MSNDSPSEPTNERDKSTAETSGPDVDSSAALRSVHTTTFPQILESFRSSIAVSTYQAGKLVILRRDEGVINTHFRNFRKPMGLAVGLDRLAVGTAHEVVEFRNIPAVCQKLEPVGKHDACFIPRRTHNTGDIQIHEMAYVGNELWFVNTAFSCICTYESNHSFVPHWRPKFVSAYTPDDRCHLNGMCCMDGKPRWVTALGETDTGGGWRQNKKNGGILIDVESNEIITRELSMPHSPRFHEGKLWVLESGKGGLGTVDLQTGKYEMVAQLDGFTRGLDFYGNVALVGLSQVRESAVFSGLEITERLTEAERTCGVWAIDIRSGQTIGFVKFEDAVQEIFGVSLIRGSLYPDLINDNLDLIAGSYVLPDDALKDVPSELRSTT